MEKKKKSKHFIIPAKNFIDPSKTPSNNRAEGNNTAASNTNAIGHKEKTITPPSETIKVSSNQQPEVIEKPPSLKTNRRRSSSVLSLNSIQKKKELKKAVLEENNNTDTLPKNPFTEAEFLKLWEKYIEKLHRNGEKIVASIMNSDTPKINGNVVELTFPNGMMRGEFNKNKSKLLRYIREKLNNYSVDFEIHVNEENTKKFAYTPQEKYNKLLEKNKALAKLKNTFKLDL